jgi:hypothetical protein
MTQTRELARLISQWEAADAVAIEEARAQGSKRKARQLANKHKRWGLLEPQPCEVCGAKSVEMHHDNYNAPLSVRWLCFRHHRMAHGQLSPPDKGWPRTRSE